MDRTAQKHQYMDARAAAEAGWPVMARLMDLLMDICTEREFQPTITKGSAGVWQLRIEELVPNLDDGEIKPLYLDEDSNLEHLLLECLGEAT
jgi:hypothetical protein